MLREFSLTTREGLALMVLAEGRWLRSGSPVDLDLAKRWSKGAAVLFAVGAISAYTGGHGSRLYLQVAIIALMSVAVAFATSTTWAVFGAAIGRWLRSPLALRLFNLAMALLLVASIVPILGEIRTGLHLL